MPEWITSQLIFTFVTGVISGVLSSWLTYILAWRRFRTERWWDRRADAYERIIDALHAAKKFSDFHIDYQMRGQDPPKEDDERLRGEAKRARAEIDRAIDIGKLILPADALQRLYQYSKEADSIKTTDWVSYLEQDYNIINRCLIDIAVIARKDLAPRF
jgi:hypothetical protein